MLTRGSVLLPPVILGSSHTTMNAYVRVDPGYPGAGTGAARALAGRSPATSGPGNCTDLSQTDVPPQGFLVVLRAT